MILYFSGTGNSKFLAEKLADLLDDQLIDLFTYIKNEELGKFHSEKPFVLVSPTYGWRLPRFLTAYLKGCKFSGTTDAYVLMDYGDSFGNAEKYIRRDLANLGLNFKGLYGLKMPENYIMLFNLDSDETNRKIIEASKKEILKVAKFIENREDFPQVKSGLIGFLQSSLINWGFYKFTLKDKKFYYTDKCIKCGLCERVCVLNNISYKDGYPYWKGTCTHCAACISKCPTGAIEYGKKTVGKDRYLLKKLLKDPTSEINKTKL